MDGIRCGQGKPRKSSEHFDWRVPKLLGPRCRLRNYVAHCGHFWWPLLIANKKGEASHSSSASLQTHACSIVHIRRIRSILRTTNVKNIFKEGTVWMVWFLRFMHYPMKKSRPYLELDVLRVVMEKSMWNMPSLAILWHCRLHFCKEEPSVETSCCRT